jgi:hypothetical protein
MWTMRRELAVVAMIGAGVLSGCGSAAPRTVTVVTATSTANTNADLIRLPAAATETSCLVYLQGHDAEVRFSAVNLQVDPECTNWERVMAARDELWIEDQPGLGQLPGALCSLTDPQGNVHVTVSDDGTEDYGREACTSLLASGWTTH